MVARFPARAARIAWAWSTCMLLGSGMLRTVEAGSPRLARLTPPGGQRGTTVDVVFTGRHLERPQEVLFYEAGITAESIEFLEGELEAGGRRERIEPGTRVRVRLKVDEACQLGAHGLRLRTAQGLSDYQRFFVGPFPILEEDETPQRRNDKPEAAKVVPPNSTVFGRMNDGPDLDLYRVQFKQGQRISAEIVAARLGTERGIPDLHLTIFDPTGKQLAATDDSALFVQDPVLSIQAAEDGEYLIAVRHSIYNAVNDIYLLHLGTFPRPTGFFPAGGQVGQELDVRVLGDPQGAWSQRVAFPLEQPGVFPFVASHDGLPAPTPNLLRISPFPNVLEAEPNNSPEAVKSVSAEQLPVAFNGILSQPGDVDCFRFQAKKGERFRVHALANALGSPLDPTISIQPLEGAAPPDARRTAAVVRATDSRLNQLGLPPSNGTNRDTLDPVLEFTVPADGDYVLTVEDDRGAGGSDFVYRIEFRREEDAVYTYVPQEPENQQLPQARQAVNVAAGNRYNTSLAIFSTNRAYPGELELVALGLPEGVTMHAPRVTAAMPRVPVVFEAAADAPLAGRLIDIVARPVAPAGESSQLESGFRQTIAMNLYGNNDFYLHTLVDKLALCVTESAPFSIEVDEPKSALVQNGEMGLKFKVHRVDGFDGAVTVSMEWRPNGINAATPIRLKSGESAGEYVIGAARNAAAGTYQVVLTCVSGSERPGYGDTTNRIYVATQPFQLKIAEPHVDARFARTSIERGKTAQLTVKLNHLKPFAGKAKATLARLPRGIQLVEPAREITSEDKEVSFTLAATDEALVGNYQGITLDLTVMEDGQAVRQLSGYGLLRVDAERRVASTK